MDTETKHPAMSKEYLDEMRRLFAANGWDFPGDKKSLIPKNRIQWNRSALSEHNRNSLQHKQVDLRLRSAAIRMMLRDLKKNCARLV